MFFLKLLKLKIENWKHIRIIFPLRFISVEETVIYTVYIFNLVINIVTQQK